MGSATNGKLEARDRKQDAKEKRREGGGSARLQAARGNAGAGLADWGSVNPAAVVGLISVVTATDAMVSFSYSRDGGAFCVSIYDNGDKERFWIPCNADVEAELHRLAEFWV
jgi:hypothetical protein